MPTLLGLRCADLFVEEILEIRDVPIARFVETRLQRAPQLAAGQVFATRLDSTLKAAEAREANDAIAGGKLELLYVTPERLQNADQTGRAGHDEASCPVGSPRMSATILALFICSIS